MILRHRVWCRSSQYIPVSVLTRSLARWIADQPVSLSTIGIGTVVFEWALIVAVFWRRARLLLMPIAILFHAAILITMGIHVGEAWLVVLCVDWDWVSRRKAVRILAQGFSHAGAPAYGPSIVRLTARTMTATHFIGRPRRATTTNDSSPRVTVPMIRGAISTCTS